MRTVFLSSTGRDLRAYREAVYRAIHGLDGYHCVRMEDFGARDWQADDFCRAKVAACDLFVGIVGHVYGEHPEHSEQSYTEREFDAATKKPRLMFLAPADFPLPANLQEADAPRLKQAAFRQRVSKEHIRDTFTSVDDLAARVVRAIRNWEQEQPLRAKVSVARLPSAFPIEYFEALRRAIEMAPFVTPPSSASLQRPAVQSVYVPVYIHDLSRDRGAGADLAVTDQRSSFRSAWESWRPEEDGPLVILGGPGAGKTTLLKHVGLCALEAAVGTNRPEVDLTFTHDAVPVFIRCAGLKARAASVAKVIARQSPQVDLQVPEGLFQDSLKDGRCLLLLDGLDEATDAEHTARLSRWVEKLHTTFPKVRIVLTSRWASYKGAAQLRTAHRVLNLAPLETGDMELFLRRWYPTIEADAIQAEAYTRSLLKALQDPQRQDLLRLAATPLMLVIMAFVHRVGRGLPERRVELYDLCVNILLEHWNKETERKPIPADLGRTILRPIAFWMQCQPERRSAAQRDIEALIAPALARTPGLHERDPTRFLETLRDRSTGLFTGVNENEYAFQHLTFQEYLAAQHVDDQPDEPFAHGTSGDSR